jgi:hypothetical protein
MDFIYSYETDKETSFDSLSGVGRGLRERKDGVI